MPTQANRDLYLQVGGDVSNLKAAMKDGRTSLLDLVAAAAEAQDQTNAALRNISADPAALKQLVSAYDQTFATIRRNAQAAMSANDNSSGLKIIDAAGAQQQAAAVAAQAAQLRILADAAATVAERQGEAGVAARVLAAALEVQAVDAAKVAAAMRGQASVLAEVAQEAKLAGASEDELSGGHSRMGASGMIAEHVVRSLSDSIAAGQSPIRAVTMEMGRITEALTMFAQNAGEAKGAFGKFASFMGGPWGLAISVAVALLTPLIAEFFEAKEAADLAKIGADGLSEAQSTLGKIFDLTSGKLQKQNELMLLNARLTAVNLRADAAKEKASSTKAFADAGTPTLTQGVVGSLKIEAGLGLKYILGTSDFGLINSGNDKAGGSQQVRALAQRARSANGLTYENKRASALDGVLRASEHTDFTNSSITKEAFQQAITDAASSRAKTAVAGEIDKSLDTGVLEQGLRSDPKKPRKPKVDHTTEREANKDRAYQAELNTAQDRYAKAQLALADTAEGRYEMSIGELDAAMKARDQEIADQLAAGKFGKADSDIAKAKAAQLTLLNDQTADLEKQDAQRTLDSYYSDRLHKLTEDSLDAQIALDQIDEQMATTRQARLDLERKILSEQQKRDLDAQQKIIDDPKSTDDEKTDAKTTQSRINTRYAAQGKVLEQQNLDPLAAYGQQLHNNTDKMNDALKNVAVDGLKGIEDGLAGIIDGTETAAQAFKKLAESIISDLARIEIEKALVSILGFSTGGSVGAVVPGSHAGGGSIVGAGTGTSDSILSWLSNGEFVINVDATRKHLPLLRAINDNALPGFATGGLVGDISYPALPSAASIAPRGSGAALHFDLRGAVMTADLIAQMQNLAIASGGQAYTESVKHTNRSIAGLSRRTL